MEFLVNANADPSGNATSVIVREGANTLFQVVWPTKRNNIDGWRTCFTYLLHRDPDELKGLFTALPGLLEIQVDEEAQPTYTAVLQALLRWLEEETPLLQEQTGVVYDFQELRNMQDQLENSLYPNALFRFQVDSTNSQYYEAAFPQLTIHIPRDTFEQSPVEVSRAMLVIAYEQRPEPVEYFIANYVRFQAHVTRNDQTTFKVFMNLSKALVRLIQHENTNLSMYMHQVPDICTFIVKHEPEGEEQKLYLESILSSLERVERKLERLDTLIQDIHNDLSQREVTQLVRSNRQEETTDRRLMHMISVISDHYLRLYDLDRSVSFWQKAKSKDPILQFFLILHRWPILCLIFQVVLLSIPTWYAYQHWINGQSCPHHLPCPLEVSGNHPAMLVMLLLYALLSLLVFAILVQVLRKRWWYSQLLLPRVLGAAIVGLLPLLLNDQSWEIGIQNNLINVGLWALFMYSGSFIYVFIEVYNAKKFIQGHSIAKVLKESRKIFLIALAETLLIVTVTSTVIFPAISASIVPTLVKTSAYNFGIYATTSILSFGFSLGFFPLLILLWTGTALFIGSFVQLLWQGQRITEAI